MYIVSIHVRGFRDLPSASLVNCTRQMHLNGPSPATTALGDAIELAFAALSSRRLHRMAARRGLVPDGSPPEDDATDFPDELHDCDPIAVSAIVEPGPRRTLHVTLELHLDPPLFGQLRDHAAREPQVALALAQRPTVTLGVGALFTKSLETMAIHIDEFRVADIRFPVHGKERPQWLSPFLRQLQDRHHRYDRADDAPEALLEAACSRDHYPAYQAWQNALGPDGPHLRVAKDANDLPVLLGNDLPLRRYGPPIIDMATLAAAIHLTNADILWAESDGLVLSNATETDPSPLEQVFRVGSNGTIQVEADPPRPQPTRGTPRAWATSKS